MPPFHTSVVHIVDFRKEVGAGKESWHVHRAGSRQAFSRRGALAPLFQCPAKPSTLSRGFPCVNRVLNSLPLACSAPSSLRLPFSQEYLDRHESHGQQTAGKRPFLFVLSPDTLQLVSGQAGRLPACLPGEAGWLAGWDCCRPSWPLPKGASSRHTSAHICFCCFH